MSGEKVISLKDEELRHKNSIILNLIFANIILQFKGDSE